MKKVTFIVLVAIILIIIIHLLTLSRSPFPWFDEVSFAIITRNLQDGHGLLWPEVYGSTEVLLYGPVYFWIQNQITGLLGWGPFQFRILNFVSAIGLLTLIIFYANQLLRYHKDRFILIGILALLIVTDIVFIQNMHSGRMDLFSVFVFFAGFHFWIKSKESTFNYAIIVISGLLMAVSLLITPRVVFCFSMLIGYFLFEVFDKGFFRIIKFYLIIAAIVIGTYLVWIYFKFNSLSEFVNYYLNDKVINDHIGSFSLIRYNHQIPIYFLIAISFILSLKYFRLKLHLSLLKVIFSMCLLILTYLLLVEEVGPYIAMIMPFLYLMSILGYAINNNKYISGIYISLFVMVVIINIGSFIFKFGVIAATWSDRNPSQQKIIELLPRGANVAADFKYYYLLINNGNNFTSIRTRLELDKVAEYHLNNFKTEYVVLSDTISRYEKGLLLEYRKLGELKLISIINSGESDSYLNKYIRKFNYNPTQNYNGFLYKVTHN